MSTSAQELAGVLALQVIDGTLPAHQPLPTIRQLAADYAVSVPTVQRAVERLISAGLVRHGARQQPIVINFEDDAGIEALEWVFREAEKLPDLVSKYFVDLLELNAMLVGEIAVKIFESDNPALHALVTDAAATAERMYTAEAEPRTVFLQDNRTYRAICRLLNRPAVIVLMNTVERILGANDVLVAALYADPLVTKASWQTMAELLATSDGRQDTAQAAGSMARQVLVAQIPSQLDRIQQQLLQPVAA